jgi:hypothetical protein
MILKIFITLLILLSGQLAAGEIEKIGTSLPYDVGDTLPDTIILDEKNKLREFINPLSAYAYMPIYPVTLEGIKYYYGFMGVIPKPDRPKVIARIIVMDTAFVTPEGLKVGQPFTDALPFSKGEIIQRYDCWKVYAKLPSGWKATYLTSELGKYSKTDFVGKLDTIPIDRRKIEYFLKTGHSSEHDSWELRTLKKIEGYDNQPENSEQQE